jgi:hypothetical protein
LDIPRSFYEFLKFGTISGFKTIEKHLNPRAAETGPRLQPTGRGGLLHAVGRKASWAMAWQPSLAGKRPARPAATRARRARRRGHHAQTARGTARWRAPRRQGVAGDLEGGTGEVSGKEETSGAHQNGVSTVRRCKRRRAAAFNGGGVAPVVVEERG